MNTTFIIVLSVISLLLGACIVVLILHIIKFRKYEEKYNNLWSKFQNENFEKDIEYLIQKGYMPGCGADICAEIDEKLMSCDVRRVNDFSLEHGLYGWLHYIVAHIQGANRCGKQVFDRMYITDLARKLKEYFDTNEAAVEFRNLYKMLVEAVNGATDVYKFPLDMIIKKDIKFTINNISLQKGLAGYLMTKNN